MEINNYNDLVDIIPNTKITIEFEKGFWIKYILEQLIQKPDKCPLCNYTSYVLSRIIPLTILFLHVAVILIVGKQYIWDLILF